MFLQNGVKAGKADRGSGSGKAGKKRKSISKKLMQRMLIILIPALFILIAVACKMASTAIETLSQEKMEAQTDTVISIVDGFFDSKLSVAEIVSVNPAVEDFVRNTTTVADINAYEAMPELLHQLSDIFNETQDENIQAVWVVNLSNEQMLFSTGQMADAGLAMANWDDLVLNTNKSAVCDPYVDTLTGKEIISIVAPVYAANGTEIAGIVGLDVTLSVLNEELGDIQVGEAGYMELLSTDSVYIISDDAAAIGKNVSELDIEDNYKNNIRNRYEGEMTFKYGGIAYRSLSRISDSTNWLAVTTLPQDEIDATRDTLVLVMLALSAILLVILVIMISRMIFKMLHPLSEVGRDIQKFAEGNLDVEIEVRSDDEIGQLAHDARALISTLRFIVQDIHYLMSEMAEGNFKIQSKNLAYYKGDFEDIIISMRDLRNRMNRTLLQIENSSSQVSAGSEQVSASAQALSQGASEQAASIEELATTVHEISEQIQATAMHAEKARERTDQSGSEIMACNQQMQDMIAAMNEISEKSDEIGKIIKAIEDIAFQTNILALNAAVEAARAGEAGKGFAVVADEVRNLAAKSAEASKSTADLIESTVLAVEKGTKIANTTGESLHSVVDGVTDVVSSVDEIALATDRQATSVAQVTRGIEQISSVVQTNSATAEESAAASEELSGQALMLKNLVEQFQVGDIDATGRVAQVQQTEQRRVDTSLDDGKY